MFNISEILIKLAVFSYNIKISKGILLIKLNASH